VRSLDSRNFLHLARLGKIARGNRGRYDAGRIVSVGRVRAEMAWPPARRCSDRARAFGLLFPDRHVHRAEHYFEPGIFALLDIPPLKET
jgi:hypothetical protein